MRATRSPGRGAFPAISLAGMLRLLFAGSLALCACPGLVFAGEAAPGDVYYSAHVDQKFKYYVFADDYVQWADETVTGTSLLFTAAHDTVTVHGSAGVSTALSAEAGRCQIDFASEMWLEARTGIFHQTYNDLVLETYIRGPAGTSYDVTVQTGGLLVASREGGLPGTLQPVNGVSTAAFEESTLTVQDGGTESLPLNGFELLSGVTTTEILVDGETYSRAFSRVFTTHTSVAQAFCILGCMTEAADFHVRSTGTVTVTIYPNGIPASTPSDPSKAVSLQLSGSPNPARGACNVSFVGRAGAQTTVDLYNVNGQRVGRLFDGISSGAPQIVRWDAGGQPSGVCFLRLESGREGKTAKLMLME